MKKRITGLLIILILITTLIPRFVYAGQQSAQDIIDLIDKGAVVGGATQQQPDGSYLSKERERSVALKSSQGPYIASVFAQLISAVGRSVSSILGLAVGAEDGFTAKDLVTGKYLLFDINFFKIQSYGSGEVDVHNTIEEAIAAAEQEEIKAASDPTNINRKIKFAVADYYYMVRNIAIIASLAILLYIAIRMAISTVAEEQVKYKKMLLNWVKGFALIFLLHYIMIIMIYFSDALVKLLASVAGGKELDFERTILEQFSGPTYQGWDALAVAFLYCVLVFYQLKLFFLYSKRLIATGFLAIVSPLIAMLYPIDKVKDNKAQTFKAWNEEWVVNIFIQPIHVLLYVVFVYSAMQVTRTAPLVGILFLFGLSRAEKIVKQVFGMRGKTSIKSMSETLKFRAKE